MRMTYFRIVGKHESLKIFFIVFFFSFLIFYDRSQQAAYSMLYILFLCNLECEILYLNKFVVFDLFSRSMSMVWSGQSPSSTGFFQISQILR